MKAKSICLLIVLLPGLFLSGCGGGEVEPASDSGGGGGSGGGMPEPEAAETQTEVSFTADVAPIFEAKCNACHHPDNAVKVDLTRPFHPELGIINRPNTWTRSSKPILVVPGDPDASALIWKVEQTELELKVDGDH